MIPIPNRETKQIRQFNNSKIYGELQSSFNLDLGTNKGTFMISPRMKLAESSATEANMGLPVAFRHADSKLYMIAGNRVFYSSTGTPEGTWTEDTDTGAKTNYDSKYSDMEVCWANLYTTTQDELMKKTIATDTWSEIDAAFASETTPHPLCYFKKFDRLYYVDNGFVASINSSDAISSGDYEIDLAISSIGVVTCMESSASSIFIGVVKPSDGSENGDVSGSVIEWDGRSSVITREYKLESSGPVAMAIKNDTPYIIDSRGRLLEYRGNSFQEVEKGNLPYKSIHPFNSSKNGNERFVHPNGFISLPDNSFLLAFNNKLGDNAGSVLDDMPSGVLKWTPENGWTHFMSPSYTSDTTITDYGQMRVSAVGALMNMDRQSTSATRNGRYICGVTYFTDATTTQHGVFYDDSNDVLQKYGSFTTSWITSSGMKDSWNGITVKLRALLNSTDEVVLKYRTRDVDPVYIDITWNDTTSFHTTTDISAYAGYEVEIQQGVGSGRTTHISSISGSSPWKANLDETFTGATGTAKAKITNFKKAFTVNRQDMESDVWNTTDLTSERIQLKCCAKVTGENEIHEVGVINKVYQY